MTFTRPSYGRKSQGLGLGREKCAEKYTHSGANTHGGFPGRRGSWLSLLVPSDAMTEHRHEARCECGASGRAISGYQHHRRVRELAGIRPISQKATPQRRDLTSRRFAGEPPGMRFSYAETF